MGRPVNIYSKGKSNGHDDVYYVSQPSGADDRLVVLHGEVNEHSISNVIVQLLHLANQNHKPIHLVISTYGGSVDEMFSLYDTIKSLPCPIHTIHKVKNFCQPVVTANHQVLAIGAEANTMDRASIDARLHAGKGKYSNAIQKRSPS
jgi:diphthamide synthase subunit DPH2